jgi:hypothetical protein
MTDFGFQPGILDYWMLPSDWRNGSFAILALSVLFLGYTLVSSNKNLPDRAPSGISVGCTKPTNRASAPTGAAVGPADERHIWKNAYPETRHEKILRNQRTFHGSGWAHGN